MLQGLILLDFVTRTAPRKINAGMVSLAYMIGYLGKLYEKVIPTKFWLRSSGVSAMGVVLVLVFMRSSNRALLQKDQFDPNVAVQEIFA